MIINIILISLLYFCIGRLNYQYLVEFSITAHILIFILKILSLGITVICASSFIRKLPKANIYLVFIILILAIILFLYLFFQKKANIEIDHIYYLFIYFFLLIYKWICCQRFFQKKM